MTITVTTKEIREMLEDAARSYGLDFDRFVALGRDDALYEPELRDLWLIWGGSVEERDAA